MPGELKDGVRAVQDVDDDVASGDGEEEPSRGFDGGEEGESVGAFAGAGEDLESVGDELRRQQSEQKARCKEIRDRGRAMCCFYREEREGLRAD
jgi:hypothetical protein